MQTNTHTFRFNHTLSRSHEFGDFDAEVLLVVEVKVTMAHNNETVVVDAWYTEDATTGGFVQLSPDEAHEVLAAVKEKALHTFPFCG